MFNEFVLGTVALASVWLAWRWSRHFATWKVEDFLAAGIFPLALTGALLLFLKTPFRDAASDVPSVFAYAPSRFLRTPKETTLAAAFMSGAFLLGTLLWAHRRLGAYRPPYMFLGALLCYLALFNLGGTATLATTIHAHAPAAGFGMLACACLFRRGEEGPPGAFALLFSTLFTSLSVLSAPVAIALPVALAAHLGFAWGRKTFLRYLLFLVGMGGALTLTLFLLGGSLSRPSWKTDLGEAARTFLQQGWQVLVLLPVAVALRLRHTDQEGGRLRRDAATIPLLAGLCLIPSSLMEAAAGGTGATCFYALFYLVAALSLLLTSSGGTGADEFSRRWARGLLVGLAGGILFFASGQIRDAWTTPASLPVRLQPGK
ncbi:MAG TPA: hypothetical protein VMU54_10760 [Planctomycetota bacterium]|nr:hypothetical protein [Planctomycetota bacterium]